MDTKLRSMVKSIVWRVIGIIILAVIAYATTSSIKEMTIITLLFHSIRVILYYIHERVWEHINWGRLKHPLAEIPIKGKLSPADMDIIREKLKELGYL
ncbi:MAG: DUF2061 domain-containing protein [Candidatus Hydrogenedentota bacterium]